MFVLDFTLYDNYGDHEIRMRDYYGDQKVQRITSVIVFHDFLGVPMLWRFKNQK